MRRNSGNDESRNRNLDPTMRDRERERSTSGTAILDGDANKDELVEQRTAGMGSHARKRGQKGD